MSTTAGMLPPEVTGRGLAPDVSTWERRVALFGSGVGLAVRMRFEQGMYSLTHLNAHFQDVPLELTRLGRFLRANGVSVQSAVDVGCGDGAITARLRDLLGLAAIAGVERNKRLADIARRRGVRVVEADMERMRSAVDYDLVVSYGSLHHSANIEHCVRTLAGLSRGYVLVVDNTVRNTPLHRVTGSAWFPFELSPYRIRTREEIADVMRNGLRLVAIDTFRNANIWHDRSFFLARVE